MVAPMLGDSSRQTKAGNGYSRDQFTIDYDTRTATCPQGQKSATWNHGVYGGIEKNYITFPQRACWTCDAQPACTTSKARQRGLTIYPRELHEIQQAQRTAQGTKTWRADYQRRAGIEGTMNQAANTVGLRKASRTGSAPSQHAQPSRPRPVFGRAARPKTELAVSHPWRGK
jgi:Transposase DDE domain